MIGPRVTSVLATRRTEPRQGDYLTDGRELYRVEEVLEGHALLEDCRSLVMVDIDRRTLTEMNVVRRADDPPRGEPARRSFEGGGSGGVGDDS